MKLFYLCLLLLLEAVIVPPKSLLIAGITEKPRRHDFTRKVLFVL